MPPHLRQQLQHQRRRMRRRKLLQTRTLQLHHRRLTSQHPSHLRRQRLQQQQYCFSVDEGPGSQRGCRITSGPFASSITDLILGTPLLGTPMFVFVCFLFEFAQRSVRLFRKMTSFCDKMTVNQANFRRVWFQSIKRHQK